MGAAASFFALLGTLVWLPGASRLSRAVWTGAIMLGTALLVTIIYTAC